MRTFDQLSGARRVLWLLPVSVLAVLTIVASGGGGGGDGDGPAGGGGGNGDDEPVVILPNYSFFLGNRVDGNLLTANVGGDLNVTMDIFGLLASSLDLDVSADNSVTFLSYTVRAGNEFDLAVTSETGSPLAGNFTVDITEDAFAVVDEQPTSGALTVFVAGDRIDVAFGSTSVQLSLNGGTPVDIAWDVFEDLLEDEAGEVWQRRASLAANAVGFIYELFFTVADVLEELEAVTQNNPTVAPCDPFTGSPPEGVLAQGETSLTWLGSGELSDGDDFDWRFTQCWNDDPFDSVDGLLDGTISMQEYSEIIDFNTNVLFEIGFGGLGRNSPGGVVFDMTVSETVEQAGVFSIPPEDVIVVTGGFVMIIQEPVQ